MNFGFIEGGGAWGDPVDEEPPPEERKFMWTCTAPFVPHGDPPPIDVCCPERGRCIQVPEDWCGMHQHPGLPADCVVKCFPTEEECLEDACCKDPNPDDLDPEERDGGGGGTPLDCYSNEVVHVDGEFLFTVLSEHEAQAGNPGNVGRIHANLVQKYKIKHYTVKDCREKGLEEHCGPVNTATLEGVPIKKEDIYFTQNFNENDFWSQAGVLIKNHVNPGRGDFVALKFKISVTLSKYDCFCRDCPFISVCWSPQTPVQARPEKRTSYHLKQGDAGYTQFSPMTALSYMTNLPIIPEQSPLLAICLNGFQGNHTTINLFIDEILKVTPHPNCGEKEWCKEGASIEGHTTGTLILNRLLMTSNCQW